MAQNRPGMSLKRVLKLIEDAIAACRLDLSSLSVFTEAASGAYLVTPIIAAVAGADQVFALTRDTRHGTVSQITAQTLELARFAGVHQRISVISEKTAATIGASDIITNTGHVRPIDARTVALMKPTAVVTLMYESWELRPEDVDVEACCRTGIAVAGVNEQHPAVDTFSYLGIMATKLLIDAGMAVYRTSILLLCNNPFGPPLARDLTKAGARVDIAVDLDSAPAHSAYDVILISQDPQSAPPLRSSDAEKIANRYPRAVVVQFLGELDRPAFCAAGIPFWPLEAPPYGHMGILPSEIGPDPIVRLQTGGLKTGEVMARYRIFGSNGTDPAGAVAAAVSSGFGQALLV